MDAYSTRTVQVRAKERELARAWERRHGRPPTSRELLHIANDATLQSRTGKHAGPIDWDALAARWDATLGGQLASIAPNVSNARGPDANTPARDGSREPTAPPSRETQARAVQKALALVSTRQSTWTRHDLLKHLALVMPPETRQMTPHAAQQLLLGLADEILSGRTGDAVCLEAPEWPPLPQSLRRDLDGRSIYTRPGTARYATATQLSAEEQLVAHAQTQAAPRMPGERVARRLGADPALLDAQLRGPAPDTHDTPGGLRLDQAAAVWHVLTSARTVEVITGPAGTGKTRVLATAARIWDGPVIGTATSQNATNGLRAAGIAAAVNTTRLLADIAAGRIPPGSLILADEASMISLPHLAAITAYAARHSCKLVLAGDQEQLAAVEGGGAMTLLAGQLGYVQLAEPVRFTAPWERRASLRLRHGDATALDDYDQHGRIQGAPPDHAIDQAARAYVAAYLDGRDVLLMAADWARCRELSARIRDDLIHLGLVERRPRRPHRRRRLRLPRRPDHLPGQRPHPPGRRTRPDARQRRHPAHRGHHRRRPDRPPPARHRPPHRPAPVHRPGLPLPRLPDRQPRLRHHRALRPGRHRAHRHRPGHRHRRPPVALPRPDPRHRRQPRVRLHHPRPPRRPAARHPPRPRTRPLRPPPPPPRRTPAGPADTAKTGSADPREPIAVLADILTRDGAELSATATRQRNLANADHLAILNAIWTAETTPARHDRYRDLVTAALPPGYRQPLSHQARWLYRTLHAAELAGLDPADVIATAIAARDLAGARDIAAVLDARIRPRVYPLLPQPQGPLDRTSGRSARLRPSRLPGPDRHPDGRPDTPSRPAHRPAPAPVGHHRPRPRPRLPS